MAINAAKLHKSRLATPLAERAGEFAGKVVFITGAGAGIGRETALSFARLGAQLVLAGRRAQPLEETRALIAQEGGLDALAIADCDVSIETNVKNALNDLMKTFGRLDIAFNNAGVVDAQGPLGDVDGAAFKHLMSINVDGAFYSMKHEVAHMLATLKRHGADAGSGGQCRIVNTSSCAGLIGFKGASAYVASKFAVEGLTKSCALDYAQDGIAVNAICPGPIRTALIKDFFDGTDEGEKALLSTVPMRRMGAPADVAELVVAMCAPGMRFMTGASVSVDGGQTAGYAPGA